MGRWNILFCYLFWFRTRLVHICRYMNFVNSKHSPGDSFLEELAIAKTAKYSLTTSEINWIG